MVGVFLFFFPLSENNIYTVYREQLLRGSSLHLGLQSVCVSPCRGSRCRWSQDGVIGLREVRVLGVSRLFIAKSESKEYGSGTVTRDLPKSNRDLPNTSQRAYG